MRLGRCWEEKKVKIVLGDKSQAKVWVSEGKKVGNRYLDEFVYLFQNEAGDLCSSVEPVSISWIGLPEDQYYVWEE